MTIYEIDQKIMEAFDAAIDQDTGEIVDQEAYAAFLRLDMERDVKIENTALWVKDQVFRACFPFNGIAAVSHMSFEPFHIALNIP